MLNNITIMGRLVQDPELRYTQNQKAVANFTVAVDRDIGEATDFIPCVAWDRAAEFMSKYFRKGSMVLVKGSLRQRNWVDKEGRKRTDYEIASEHIYFGERKNERSQMD